MLYDASLAKVFLVAQDDQTITELQAERAMPAETWQVRMSEEVLGGARTVQAYVDGRLCVEIRSAPLLQGEMGMITAFKQALSANQLAAWERTPADFKDACHWLLEIRQPGMEYGYGLPLVIRYEDGRQRRYKQHQVRDMPDSLLALPQGFRRMQLEGGP